MEDTDLTQFLEESSKALLEDKDLLKSFDISEDFFLQTAEGLYNLFDSKKTFDGWTFSYKYLEIYKSQRNVKKRLEEMFNQRDNGKPATFIEKAVMRNFIISQAVFASFQVFFLERSKYYS